MKAETIVDEVNWVSIKTLEMGESAEIKTNAENS